jgi:hypothetical protein
MYLRTEACRSGKTLPPRVMRITEFSIERTPRSPLRVK